MSKPSFASPASGCSKELAELIDQKEPRLLHTEVLPELLSLGWGLVQRVYFFERTEEPAWRRGRVTVRPRPLTLAFAQQDVEDVRAELGGAAHSAACLLYSLEVGPGVPRLKEWRVVTHWLSAEESVSRVHHFTRSGRVQSVTAPDALTALVPAPLRAHAQAIASLEREYRLVAHELCERIRDILDGPDDGSARTTGRVRELEALVLEVSARRADDVLASYLCVTASVQEQARELVQRTKDQASEREKRQARQTEERIRRLQHQLDIANKRTAALELQLRDARQREAHARPETASFATTQSGAPDSASSFEEQCAARLRTSAHWRGVLSELVEPASGQDFAPITPT